MAIDPTLNADFLTFPGDTVIPTFSCVDSSGAAVDISSATAIQWIVRAAGDGSTALATVTYTTAADSPILKLSSGTGGQFTVNVGSTITTGLDGAYQHVAKLTFPGPVGIVTAMVGRMMVNAGANWSYNAAKVSTVPLYMVRLLLGDTIPDQRQLFDSEITAFLSNRAGNTYLAAADAARAIAGRYARKVDTNTPGGISTAYGDQMDKYLKLADILGAQSKQSGRFVTGFAGGISIAQKVNTQLDTDRVQPSFNIGMQDNLMVPVPQVGNETPTMPLAGGPGPGSGG